MQLINLNAYSFTYDYQDRCKLRPNIIINDLLRCWKNS